MTVGRESYARRIPGTREPAGHRDIGVGVFGAMEAGLAAAPLDPAWPEARLRMLLDRAGIDLVLSPDGTRDV